MTLNDILQRALQAYNTGQFEKSRQLLESGLALDEHSQPCLWGLIKVCDAVQDELGSVNYLHKLATLLPDDITVLEAFTAWCQTPKQLDLAIDLYAGYLHRRPDSADGHYNYAYLLAQKQNFAVLSKNVLSGCLILEAEITKVDPVEPDLVNTSVGNKMKECELHSCMTCVTANN